MLSPCHIVGDWGTSRLRLSLIIDGAVVDRHEGAGIGQSDRAPAEVLAEAIAPWRAYGPATSITLCGMVGSRNGWAEVPYAECPTDAANWRAHAAQVAFEGGMVTIMAGLAGEGPTGAPDVMRGEETQVFGALALDPRLARGRHLVVLPGTHSKWARMENGRITGFQTFPTGELFALLRDHSILTRVAADKDGCEGDERAGFDHGLARAGEGQLLGALFEARAAQLRQARSPHWALGYLSGLLLGREVAEAATGAGAERIILIGDPKLTARYCRTLESCGMLGEAMDGDACALAGLIQGGTSL